MRGWNDSTWAPVLRSGAQHFRIYLAHAGCMFGRRDEADKMLPVHSADGTDVRRCPLHGKTHEFLPSTPRAPTPPLSPPRLSSFPGDSPAYSSGTMPSRILRVFSQRGSGLKHCGHKLQDSCCNQRQTRRKRWQELQSARRALLKEKVIGHSGEHDPVFFFLMKRCV